MNAPTFKYHPRRRVEVHERLDASLADSDHLPRISRRGTMWTVRDDDYVVSRWRESDAPGLGDWISSLLVRLQHSSLLLEKKINENRARRGFAAKGGKARNEDSKGAKIKAELLPLVGQVKRPSPTKKAELQAKYNVGVSYLNRIWRQLGSIPPKDNP
jgi:hypothetical protein